MRHSLLLLAAPLILASAGPLPPRGASAGAGPGAVIAMHQRLFRAIDAGDAESAAAFAVDHHNSTRVADCVLFGPADGGGERAEGVREVAATLARWARESREAGGRSETVITFARDDCHDADLSYAILEFERRRQEEGEVRVQRFRSTSLVRWDEESWKIWHWHVSPVEG